MGDLGHISIIGALALSVYAIGASLVGARLRRRELILSGQNAAVGVTVLFSAATLALLVALVTHDFSIRYVYDNSSRSMPADMLMPAFYSGQKGSLLFWAWSLSLLFAIVLWQMRKPGTHRLLMPYVVATVMVVAGFMALLLAFVASPFERLPFTPPDGVGLNPLLYDDGMKIHPPMLLMGYMSWTIPFGFAIAAMVTGKLDGEWVRLIRRYAMVAWLILGLGNLLGAWWAYRVLGWGGFWGWDPVENVALMPWIVGTAFIHSLQIQERRGMLKAWNLALIMVTFFLSIFGTFIVRSGVLASVHSFALSAIGPYFLVFLSSVMTLSLGLFFWRLPKLRSNNQLESLLSREASFLLNNVLFLCITFAIFWGTVYPLVAEAITQTRVSVGPPYFKQVVSPLLGGMLLLMGIAPLMPWRRASREHLLRNLLPPTISTAVMVGLMAALGIRDLPALAGAALILFVLSTIAIEFIQGTRARHRATGENHLQAMGNLVRRNNRRYGGYVVHLGILLVAAGAIGSSAYQQEAQFNLAPGQTAQIGNYTLTAHGIATITAPGRNDIEAPLTMGDEVLRPKKTFFQNFPQQPNTTVAIRTNLFEDLYIVLAGWDQSANEQSRVTIVAYVNPLVNWIWVGGAVFLFGSFISMWPSPQPAARSVRAPSDRRLAGAAA